MNGESHVHVISRRRLCSGVERGVWKSVIKVVVENDVAIIGNARIGVGLSRAGVEEIQRGHGVVEFRVVAHDLERAYE